MTAITSPVKDGDVVLFDGAPFEYITHVEMVVVNGEISYQRPRK
jgi:imidazolonepropionase-like amidohydrolase